MKFILPLLLLTIGAVVTNGQTVRPTRATPIAGRPLVNSITTARPTRATPINPRSTLAVRASPRPQVLPRTTARVTRATPINPGRTTPGSRATPSRRPIVPQDRPATPQTPPQPTARQPTTQGQGIIPPNPTMRPNNPQDSSDFPTVGTAQPPIRVPTGPPNGGRPTYRPPRIGVIGLPNPNCPLNQDPRNPVHLPHQSNCERFYKCDHGLAFEYQCPVGQHWSVMRNLCDFPNLANCGNNNNWSDNNMNNQWSVVGQDRNNPRISNPWRNNNDFNRNQENQGQWSNNNGGDFGYQHPIQIPMRPGK